MSDPNQGRMTTTTQRELIESGERALQQSITMPFNQAVEIQRNFARLFLTGLEMQDRAQRQWIDLMKTTFDDYLNTMETTAEGVSQATRESVQSAMEPGQAPGTGGPQAQGSPTPPANRQQPMAAGGPQGGQGGLQYGQPPGGRPPQGSGHQGIEQPITQGQGSWTYEQPQGQQSQPPGQQSQPQPQGQQSHPQGQGYEQPEGQSQGQPQGQQSQPQPPGT